MILRYRLNYIALFCFFILHGNVHSSTSGFFGKRFLFTYNFGLLPEVRYAVSLIPRGFSGTHLLGAEYALSDRSSLSLRGLYSDADLFIHYGKIRAGSSQLEESFSVNTDQYTPGRVGVTIQSVGLEFKSYRYEDKAPIGRYMKFGMSVVTYGLTDPKNSISGYVTSYNHLLGYSTTSYVARSTTKDKARTGNFTIGLGRAIAISPRIIFNSGLDINLMMPSPGGYIMDGKEFKNYDDYIFENIHNSLMGSMRIFVHCGLKICII